MPRKHNVNKINLQISDIDFFKSGMVILWSSDIGFGEYIITKEEGGELIGLSECMDIQEVRKQLKESYKKL